MVSALYHGYKESCSLVCVGGFTQGSVREHRVINLHGVGVGQRDSLDKEQVAEGLQSEIRA